MKTYTVMLKVVVILTVGVAFALRFRVFTTQELGLDGHLAVGLASIPVSDMLAFNLRDVHPPLFYLVLRAWLDLVGTTFIAAKWLTVAAGVLTIPILYQLARRTIGPLPATLAALLLAFSPAHIFLSPTVRDFAPGLLLSLASLLVLHKLALFRRRPSLPGRGAPAGAKGPGVGSSHQSLPQDAVEPRSKVERWRGLGLVLGLAALTGAALLTWYFHGLYVLLQLGYLAVRRPRWARAAAAALVGGILIAVPWLAVALPPLLRKARTGTTVSGEAPRFLELPVFLKEAAGSLLGNPPLAWEIALGFWLLLLGAGTVAGWWSGRRVMAAGSLAGTALGLVAAYWLAGRWVYSTFLIRYMLIALPFAILGQVMLVAGTGTVWRKWAAAALLALIVPASTWYASMATQGGIPYEQDPVMLHLAPRLAAGDAIVFTDIARVGFYRMRDPQPVPAYAIHFTGSAFLEDDVAARTRELVPALLDRHARVWLVNSAPEKKGQMAVVEAALGRPIGERVEVHNAVTRAEVLVFPGRR